MPWCRDISSPICAKRYLRRYRIEEEAGESDVRVRDEGDQVQRPRQRRPRLVPGFFGKLFLTKAVEDLKVLQALSPPSTTHPTQRAPVRFKKPKM